MTSPLALHLLSVIVAAGPLASLDDDDLAQVQEALELAERFAPLLRPAPSPWTSTAGHAAAAARFVRAARDLKAAYRALEAAVPATPTERTH